MANDNFEGTFSGPHVKISPTNGIGNPRGLVDQYGREVDASTAAVFGPPTDPIQSPDTATVIKRDLPISVGTSWDIPSIRNALDAHMIGNFSASAFLCDAMTGDDRVAATLGQRMGSLFSRPMKTTPADDSAEAIDIADAWEKAWTKFAPLAVLEEIESWNVLCGMLPCEIQWDTSGKIWQPYLKPWHPSQLYYRYDLRKFAINTLDGAEIIEPGNGRWVLFAPHGIYRGWRRGCVRPIAVPWYFRQLVWRDWGRYNERHGLAILKAKVPARSDPTMRGNFKSGLATMGQEAVVVCPQNVDGTGYDVELLEATGRTFDTFDKSMARADMAIVLSMLWQNLTTEVNGGSYAAATVHEGVQQTAARFTNGVMSETLHDQAARVFAAWNFGRPDLAPKREWVIEQPSDHLASSQTFAAFSQAVAGLKNAGHSLTPAGISKLAFSFNLPLDENQIVAVSEDMSGGNPRVNVPDQVTDIGTAPQKKITPTDDAADASDAGEGE